jgi:AAA family ATP:ADP antiporter
MARWAYGIFLAIGSVGGIISNYLISPISLRFGTVNTALLIIPLFFICAITGYILDKKYSDNIPIKTKRKKEFFETIKIITKSIYLKYILLLVIITQIIITLIDFKFNFVLQESYPILDSRTQVIAHIHLLIDTTSLIFQLLTGLIFKFLGIKILMTSIPIINLLIIFLFTAIPHFAGMIMLKITSKVLDYSIFKPLKEMLYIPLNRKEKTKGKSFIDIFAYRSSKGLSSTVLISLIAIGAMKLIIPIIIFLQFNCIILSCIVVNKYRKIKNNKKKVNSKI